MAYYLQDDYGGYYRHYGDWHRYAGLRTFDDWDLEKELNERDFGPGYFQGYDYALDAWGLDEDFYYDRDYGHRPDYYYKSASTRIGGHLFNDESKAIVDQLLREYSVVLFVISNCSSCQQIMATLDRSNVPYYIFAIDADPNIEEILYTNALETLSGNRNVPQLFIQSKYYGDGAKIKRGLASGEIQRLCGCGDYGSSLDNNHRLLTSILHARQRWAGRNINEPPSGNKAHSVVRNLLQKHKVVLFAHTNCDSCTSSEVQLNRKRVPYKVYYVDADPKVGMLQYLEVLKELSSNRNLPQLYIHGKYYGDFQKTITGLENGEVQRLQNLKQEGSSQSQSNLETVLHKLLQSNNVIVFEYTNCSPCEQTNNLLEEHNIPYMAHLIDRDPLYEANNYFDVLERLSGIRTVPQLFIHGKFYGDSVKTRLGLESGEIQRLSR